MRQPALVPRSACSIPGGNEVTGTGPGHSGELYISSAAVFNEYYKQPGSYQAARRGDFHTVGDIAYRDDEGYYYICDRKTDMIISGGMNVYPAEIEAALEQHPGIFDVAVFGIPSEQWGEQVHATVVLAPGASLAEADVIAYARQHLAGYKCPHSVSFTGRAPPHGLGQACQARAPGAVLGRSHEADQLAPGQPGTPGKRLPGVPGDPVGTPVGRHVWSIPPSLARLKSAR